MKRFIMNHIRLVSCLLVAVASATVSSAQITVVSDPFTSSSNWGSTVTTVSQVYTNGVDATGGMSAGTSSGSLAIGSGVAGFNATMTVQNPAPAMVQIAMPLTAFTAPSNFDWSASIAATNTFTNAAGQTVQIGMFVSNTSGLSWASGPTTHDYVKLVLGNNSTNGAFIHGGLHLNGNAVSPVALQTNPKTIGGISSTTGSLVFSYVASTQVLTAGYNFNGTLYEFGSYGVAGSGGSTANADWGMGGGTFTISLYGQATNTGTAYTLSDFGAAYLDNFSTTQSTTSMTAIPEPSTYAAMFGACALAFAAWRRRRMPA